jgi:hypothetical protein
MSRRENATFAESKRAPADIIDCLGDAYPQIYSEKWCGRLAIYSDFSTFGPSSASDKSV